MTELKILGHAAVVITATDGARLLLDPFESGGFGGKMAYPPIEERVGAVVCTHEHADHAATHALPGAPVVLEGDASWGPFEITRHTVWHDEYEGRRRGGAVDLVCVEVDGVRLLHGSDVGESPRPDVIEAVGRVDVWLVPVGGFFTIGAAQAWEWSRRLGARWVVPVHHDTPWCGLGLRGVEGFLAYGLGSVREVGVGETWDVGAELQKLSDRVVI